MFWYVVALHSNDIFVARIIVVAEKVIVILLKQQSLSLAICGEAICVLFLTGACAFVSYLSRPQKKSNLQYSPAWIKSFVTFSQIDYYRIVIVYYRSKERVTSPSWPSVSNHMAIPFISLVFSLLYSVCMNQFKIYLRIYGICIALYLDAQSSLQHFVGDFAGLLI